MCGIFGFVGAGPFPATDIAATSRLLRHRGPDDEGFVVAGPKGTSWFGGPDTPRAVLESRISYAPTARLRDDDLFPGGVVLGHRRLSIVDLSAHGHQPMCYRDRYWILYNGEVYNYIELQRELEAYGHRFGSASDTEVIVAAYAQFGPGCLSRLNGMWSLAILDLHTKTLFLARDRFGVKPLYYWISGGRLLFASEIKAFGAIPHWRARANERRLLDFLVWAVSDHTAETMFEGVQQLQAGHFLLLDVSGPLDRGVSIAEKQLNPQRWYRPSPRKSAAIDAARELRETLVESVRLRLRADVPVGSCLSGGLDSSSIVCVMGELLAQSGAAHLFKTFTAGSADQQFDETGYAKAVVKRAGSEGIFVTPNPAGLLDHLAKVTWHQDEPFGSSSIFAQWSVFEAARHHGVTVMLDGQGADEILCGYRGFFGAYLAGLIRRGQLARWTAELVKMRRQLGFSWTRLLGYTTAYLVPSTLGIAGRFDHRAYSDRRWLKPDYGSAFKVDPIRRLGGRAHSVLGMSMAQVEATNLPMLLRWEDRNSMAFSVEARVPFLDYRLVELSLGLPDSDKVGGGVSKAVLRRAMRGTVPDTVLDRRDKMGFVTAEPLWMRRDLSARFRQEIAAAIDSMPRLLSPTLLKQFDEVVAGGRSFDQRYWRAISAGRWASTFSVSL